MNLNSFKKKTSTMNNVFFCLFDDRHYCCGIRDEDDMRLIDTFRFRYQSRLFMG